LGRVAYCPLRFGAEVLALACAGLNFGWVEARGRNLEDNLNVTRSIALLDFEIPVRWTPSRWEFWGAPGLGIGLTQRQFAVDPGPQILSEQRSVSWTLSCGARAVF